jgi:hypothetical protein
MHAVMLWMTGILDFDEDQGWEMYKFDSGHWFLAD